MLAPHPGTIPPMNTACCCQCTAAFIHLLMLLLIAELRIALLGEADSQPCSPCTLGRMCWWKGWGGGGGALQVFPPIGECWKQRSVFVFISLSKREKDT